MGFGLVLVAFNSIYPLTITQATKSDSFPLQISNIHQCAMVMDGVESVNSSGK